MYSIDPRAEGFDDLAVLRVLGVQQCCKLFRGGDVGLEAAEVAHPLAHFRIDEKAIRLADRLYAIDRGEIIFEGKPEQALEDASVMKALRG